jgi:hypothetical protein
MYTLVLIPPNEFEISFSSVSPSCNSELLKGNALFKIGVALGKMLAQ